MLLLPCQRRPVVPPREALPPEIAAHYDDELAYADRIRGASIYPAVQNILLACRGLGLGAVITTNHIRCEDEVKALLGIPEDVDTFALMPIGWPLDKFGPLTRRPLAEVVHADRWGAGWPGGCRRAAACAGSRAQRTSNDTRSASAKSAATPCQTRSGARS